MRLKANQIGTAFLIGLLVGTLVGGSKLRRHFFKGWNKGSHHERMLNRFSSRLDLTPEQKTRVGTILEGKRAKVDALFSEMRPRFDQIREETGNEIRKVLNPEQLKKFESLDAEMHERFKKRFSHHH